MCWIPSVTPVPSVRRRERANGERWAALLSIPAGSSLVDFPEVLFVLGEQFGFSFLPEIEHRPLPLKKFGDVAHGRSEAPVQRPCGAMFRQCGRSKLKLGGFGRILTRVPWQQQSEEGDHGDPDHDGPQRREPSPLRPEQRARMANAEQRFYELTGAGFTAAVRTGPAQVSRIRSFELGA
jgi:hypothetical protein